MRKYIVLFIIISSIIIVSSIQFYSKSNNVIASEKRESISTNNITPKNYLIKNHQNEPVFNYNIVKKQFDINLIGTYTSIPKTIYTSKGIPDGIYVTGTQTQTGNKLLNIYSKDGAAATNITNFEVEKNTLKIFIIDNKPNPTKEKNIVYQIKTFKNPIKFEVIRNGKLEVRRLIFYNNTK